MHFNISFFRFAAFAVVLAMPVAAQAAAYQVVVHYADLRLSNTAGARALLARLTSAARQACGGTPVRADLRTVDSYRTCLQASLDQAVADVGEPMVSSLYHEQGHAPH